MEGEGGKKNAQELVQVGEEVQDDYYGLNEGVPMADP
jgi:hypothetical protein